MRQLLLINLIVIIIGNGVNEMPGKTSRYTKAETQMIEFETLEVLANSPIALTISEIQERSLTLVGRTSQKMARVLSDLVEKGLVRKTQSKAKKRMVYMAVSQMEALGITLAETDT